jgi:cellulose synthase operon protein C
MLLAYRDGKSSAEVLRSVLRAEPEAIDRDFDAWLRGRYPPRRLAEFLALDAEARRLLAADRAEAATRPLDAAAALFAVAGEDSPYALLARIHRQRGNTRAAADALTKLTAFDESAYAENLELAGLLETLGDPSGAAAALERTIYIHPYDIGLHARLAEMYAGLGERDKVVRERRAIVALRPVDQAGALFQLALALLEAGDRAAARREVLRALEIAPGFEPAQELLLQLHGST